MMDGTSIQPNTDRIANRKFHEIGDYLWSLQLVGDGPDREYLKQLSERIGIGDKCTWSGWENDPWSVVTNATILAFPSAHEGFGAVVIEAMARGIPVLSTDCNFGPLSVIRAGVNGCLVPVDDNVFAEQLAQLVDDSVPIPPPELVQESVNSMHTKLVVDRLLAALSQARGHRARIPQQLQNQSS